MARQEVTGFKARYDDGLYAQAKVKGTSGSDDDDVDDKYDTIRQARQGFWLYDDGDDEVYDVVRRKSGM